MAPAVGLCALLAADAFLIAWAFRGTPPGDLGAVGARPPASVSPSVPPSVSPSDPLTPSDAPALKPSPVEKMVTAVGPSIAWVVRAGSCEKPGTVWVTDDSGASWTSQKAPGRVMRARPSSNEAAFVTGGDADCDLRLWNTGNAGRAWSDPKPAADAWSRVPEDAKAVHTPDNTVSRPCGKFRVLDLVTFAAQRASVLCENGDVRTTDDRGVAWPKSFTAKGALALGAVDGGSGVVVRTAESCRGVVAVPLVGGKPEGDGECVRGAAEPGEVSVSGAAEGWWLVVGDQVHTAEGPDGPWTPAESALEG